MTGRAYVLPVAIAAAVGLPYMASQDHGAASTDPDGRPMSSVISNGLASHRQESGLVFPFAGAETVRGRSGSLVPMTTQFPGGAVIPMQRPPIGQGGFAGPWPQAAPDINVAGSGSSRFPSTQSPQHRVGQQGTRNGVVSPYLPAWTLFRFDITPQWIIQTWPQISSDVSDPPLAGLRTAVVTGTAIHDLAGSMTYYFDGRQQLQRIMFHGTTGDPTPLVEMLRTHYQMTSEPALNGAMYVTRDKQQVIQFLRVRLAPLVRHADPHQRYELSVELNRPGGSTALSEVHTEMLESEQRRLTSGVDLKSTSSVLRSPSAKRSS